MDTNAQKLDHQRLEKSVVNWRILVQNLWRKPTSKQCNYRQTNQKISGDSPLEVFSQMKGTEIFWKIIQYTRCFTRNGTYVNML